MATGARTSVDPSGAHWGHRTSAGYRRRRGAVFKYWAPAPVVEYIALAPAVYAVPALVVEYVTPGLPTRWFATTVDGGPYNAEDRCLSFVVYRHCRRHPCHGAAPWCVFFFFTEDDGGSSVTTHIDKMVDVPVILVVQIPQMQALTVAVAFRQQGRQHPCLGAEADPHWPEVSGDDRHSTVYSTSTRWSMPPSSLIAKAATVEGGVVLDVNKKRCYIAVSVGMTTEANNEVVKQRNWINRAARELCISLDIRTLTLCFTMSASLPRILPARRY